MATTRTWGQPPGGRSYGRRVSGPSMAGEGGPRRGVATGACVSFSLSSFGSSVSQSEPQLSSYISPVEVAANDFAILPAVLAGSMRPSQCPRSRIVIPSRLHHRRRRLRTTRSRSLVSGNLAADHPASREASSRLSRMSGVALLSGVCRRTGCRGCLRWPSLDAISGASIWQADKSRG